MLMIELDTIKNELALTIMNSLLNRRIITKNFRNLQSFSQKERKHHAPQLLNLSPEEIKQRNKKNLFKSDTKQWICKERSSHWRCS